jgi:hypothetical protein
VSASFTAPALAAVTITGEVSEVQFGASDPGLVVSANPIAFLTFTLNDVGDFAEFTVLTVGTGETAANFDDLVPLSLSVAFRFTNPTGAAGTPITGNTVGFIAPFTACGFAQGGCAAQRYSTHLRCSSSDRAGASPLP